jgi:hypothetical protein
MRHLLCKYLLAGAVIFSCGNIKEVYHYGSDVQLVEPVSDVVIYCEQALSKCSLLAQTCTVANSSICVVAHDNGTFEFICQDRALYCRYTSTQTYQIH